MTNLDAPRIGSLFSGIGGLDLAAVEVLGGSVAWHAELDPAGSRVLDHHWPDVPNLGDVSAVDWADVAPVDVLTGGFPCQDVSAAGLRAGIRPGTRSGLWSHMVYAVATLRPRLVVIENVRGLLSARAHSDVEPCSWCLAGRGGDDAQPVLRALGAVLGDLADIGFDAEWIGLPAAGVGACHERFRVFVLAWPSADTGRVHGQRRPLDQRGTSAGTRSTSDVERRRSLTLADTQGGRRPQGDAGPEPSDSDRGGRADARGGATPVVADADRVGRERDASPGPRQGVAPGGSGRVDVGWGDYAPAVRRWERILGRAAPAPTVIGSRGGVTLSARFVEWMQGFPVGWVTDVPGVSRSDALRLLGNAVVPQQGAAALRDLLARAAGHDRPPSASHATGWPHLPGQLDIFGDEVAS